MRINTGTKHVSATKLKAEYEKQWALYLNYCNVHLISDVYNRQVLEKYNNATKFMNDEGNVILEDEVVWSNYYGCYVELEGTLPRTCVEKLSWLTLVN